MTVGGDVNIQINILLRNFSFIIGEQHKKLFLHRMWLQSQKENNKDIVISLFCKIRVIKGIPVYL